MFQQWCSLNHLRQVFLLKVAVHKGCANVNPVYTALQMSQLHQQFVLSNELSKQSSFTQELMPPALIKGSDSFSEHPSTHIRKLIMMGVTEQCL